MVVNLTRTHCQTRFPHHWFWYGIVCKVSERCASFAFQIILRPLNNQGPRTSTGELGRAKFHVQSIFRNSRYLLNITRLSVETRTKKKCQPPDVKISLEIWKIQQQQKKKTHLHELQIENYMCVHFELTFSTKMMYRENYQNPNMDVWPSRCISSTWLYVQCMSKSGQYKQCRAHT